jgi:hypothetical protein
LEIVLEQVLHIGEIDSELFVLLFALKAFHEDYQNVSVKILDAQGLNSINEFLGV